MKIKKKEFEKNYKKLTLAELSSLYGVSQPTIRSTAKKLGLSKNPGRLDRIQLVD